MSYLDYVTATAGTPLLRAALGEPDEGHAIYKSPQPGVNDIVLDRPTVTMLTLQPHFDPRTGETTHRERRDLFIDRETLAAGGVHELEDRGRVNLPDGEWAIDVTESNW